MNIYRFLESEREKRESDSFWSLPSWLGTATSSTLKRIHLTLGPAKQNQDRAVLIRFLKFKNFTILIVIQFFRLHGLSACCRFSKTTPQLWWNNKCYVLLMLWVLEKQWWNGGRVSIYGPIEDNSRFFRNILTDRSAKNVLFYFRRGFSIVF